MCLVPHLAYKICLGIYDIKDQIWSPKLNDHNTIKFISFKKVSHRFSCNNVVSKQDILLKLTLLMH